MSGQSMIERCARAAHETAREPVKNLWPSYEDDTPESRTRSRQIVRAVLAELRESTEAMAAMALAELDKRSKQVTRGYIDREDVLTSWQSMIDTALSDRPAGDA